MKTPAESVASFGDSDTFFQGLRKPQQSQPVFQSSPDLRGKPQSEAPYFETRTLVASFGDPDGSGFQRLVSPLSWDSPIAALPSPERELTNPGNVSLHFFAYCLDLKLEDRALDETPTVSKLDDHLMDIDIVNEQGTVKPSETEVKMGYRSKQSLTLSYARGPSFILQQNLNAVTEILESGCRY